MTILQNYKKKILKNILKFFYIRIFTLKSGNSQGRKLIIGKRSLSALMVNSVITVIICYNITL